MGIGTLIILATAALLVLVLYGRRTRSALSPTVTVDDIPRVLNALVSTARGPAFTVFMFSTPDRPAAQDAVSLQLSLEGGEPGFDWALAGRRNTEDEERFVEFARSAGYTPVARVTNGVDYLRIEHGDIAGLCRQIVTTMYGLPVTQPLDVIVEGFEWAK
jgi:hypothetical protein